MAIFRASVGHGAPILWVHNAGTDHEIWRGIVDLIPGYRHVLMDMPGFGQSSPASSPTLEALGGAVLKVVEEEDLAQAVVVAHCVGAASCLWAQLHGANFGAMVLFSPATYDTMERGPFGKLRSLLRRWPRSQKVLTPLTRRVMNSPISRLSVSWQMGREREDVDAQLVQHLRDLGKKPGVWTYLTELLQRSDSFADLDRGGDLDCPSLLIWGTHNRVLPLSGMLGVQRSFSTQQSEIVTGGGHLLMVERPQQMSGIIQRFLQQQSVG